MVENYSFENNSKFLIGDNATYNVPYELAQLGCTRAMIVSDETSYRIGNYDYVKGIFKLHKIAIGATFRKVQDVADSQTCEEIARRYRASNCDCIIAVGKKSAIFAAKGAKILLTEDIRYISHYADEGTGNLIVRNVPLVVVPSNMGCGFENSNFVRIVDKQLNIIYEFNTKYAETNMVAIDSSLTDTLPPKAIASHGLYALAMAAECYVSDDSPLSVKAYADIAIKQIYLYLEKSILHNARKDYRSRIMGAVILAGTGFYSIPREPISVIADALSDRYLINYGNLFAILFRHYIKKQELGYSFGYCLNAMLDINEYALYARENRTQKALTAIDALYDRIIDYVDFNSKLSDFDIPKEDLESVAEDVAKTIDTVTKEQVLELLNESY